MSEGANPNKKAYPPRRLVVEEDGFPHVADIIVGSFYRPDFGENCAFEVHGVLSSRRQQLRGRAQVQALASQ